MADFCKQCTEELFDGVINDFVGLSTEADTKAGLYAAVLCEGCGLTLVDHTGKCVSDNCPKHGKTG